MPLPLRIRDLQSSHGRITVKNKYVVVHTMEVYGGIEVQLHAFLISAKDEVSGQIYNPVALSRG
jgi:hypothetical protein